MRRDDVQYVASRVAAFRAGIPRYPADVFQVSGPQRGPAGAQTGWPNATAVACCCALSAGCPAAEQSYRVQQRGATHTVLLRIFCTVVVQGRGIVMVGGGLRYMISTWVGVHMIRRSGCRLPIEMW